MITKHIDYSRGLCMVEYTCKEEKGHSLICYLDTYIQARILYDAEQFGRVMPAGMHEVIDWTIEHWADPIEAATITTKIMFEKYEHTAEFTIMVLYCGEEAISISGSYQTKKA